MILIWRALVIGALMPMCWAALPALAAADALLGLPALPAAAAADLAPTATARARVALGQALFFERRLSINGTLSCAMCHLPQQAFTSNELRTSVGMEGVSLRRNAPSLLNVAFQRSLFVDGRVRTLEDQALLPLLHADEMGQPSLQALLARVQSLQRLAAYRPLWQQAFGAGPARPAQLASALAAYQRSLLAGDSPFDRWRYGGEPAALLPLAQRGMALFQQHGCSACHLLGQHDALFSDHAFHNVGVAWRSRARAQAQLTVQLVPGLQAVVTPAELQRFGMPDRSDEGRFEFTAQGADLRAFRTPSLRNVALTAPYMHDGSLATLDEVLTYYSTGGSPQDPAQDARIRTFTLSTESRQAMLAFLRSLTSSSLAPCRTEDGACRTRREGSLPP